MHLLSPCAAMNDWSHMLKANRADVARYYTTMQIQTASRAKAVCMLHERCMHFIALGEQEQDKQRQYLDKAQNIIAQLQAALIVDDHVSRSLLFLYDFCYMLLEKGGNNEIDSARELFATLTATFNTLIRQLP
ncbi:MAG: hypothetical protein GF398_12045 [Chitinivibrionales bacterium]|nr:hypothetical protein [Chitinivibrionales bacterium]